MPDVSRWQQAAHRKRRVVYPELVAAQRCKLVALGFGGSRVHPTLGGFEGMWHARPLEEGSATGQRPQMERDAGGGGPARLRTFPSGVATGCGWRPAAHLRRGGRADGRPAVGSSRPEEIMSCRLKSPRKKIRNSGLAMNALVFVCYLNTNGIMVRAWMLCQSKTSKTRSLVFMVWAWTRDIPCGQDAQKLHEDQSSLQAEWPGRVRCPQAEWPDRLWCGHHIGASACPTWKFTEARREPQRVLCKTR